MNQESLEYYICREAMTTVADEGRSMLRTLAKSFGLDAHCACLQELERHMVACHLQLQCGALMRVVGGIQSIQQDIAGIHRIYIPIEAAINMDSQSNLLRCKRDEYSKAYGSSSEDGIGHMVDLLLTALGMTKESHTLRKSITEQFTAIWVGCQKMMCNKPLLFEPTGSNATHRKSEGYQVALKSALIDLANIVSSAVHSTLKQVDNELALSASIAFSNSIAGTKMLYPRNAKMEPEDLYKISIFTMRKVSGLEVVISHLVDLLNTGEELSMWTIGEGEKRYLIEFVKEFKLYIPETQRPIYKNWTNSRVAIKKMMQC